jgi:hypothetical protein
MKVNINIFDATLDEAQDVLDASTNAGVVRAISEAVRTTKDCYGGLMAQIEEILIGAGVLP